MATDVPMPKLGLTMEEATIIEWLVDEYGFEKMEAYQVVSQGGVTRVANVVDPNYTVVAKFPKSALPPPVKRP